MTGRPKPKISLPTVTVDEISHRLDEHWVYSAGKWICCGKPLSYYVYSCPKCKRRRFETHSNLAKGF